MAPAMTPPRFVPPDVSHLPLVVLHADPHLAVVVKPRELLSCPGTTTPGWDSVQTRVAVMFPDARGPVLAHRLDAPTSGLMVVALTVAAHRARSAQFGRHSPPPWPDKTYEALLDGALAGDVGDERTIDLPLRGDWRLRPRQVVDLALGKPAFTRCRILAFEVADSGLQTRVMFTPLTGRTHQLRVHAADARGLGCPIAGDRLYGRAAPAPDDPLRLHACGLTFQHPDTGERLTFTSRPDF